jgi:hypothetical protein
MPASIPNLITSMEFTTSTGTILKYTYSRVDGAVTIFRKITPPGGGNTVPTTTLGVRDDARQLIKVAEHFDLLERIV